MSTAPTATPKLVVAAGARAAERRLVREVLAAARARDVLVQQALARGDATAAAALLARPLRVVVSSRSQREQVSAALLREHGRALAAIGVHTHFALALEVLERAGETPPRGDALFAIELRRAAREEPALAVPLDPLRDGYDGVEAAARDLVDAGFGPALADGLDEALAASPASAERERGRALVRATARALARLEAAGLAPRAAVVCRARERIEAHAAALLPTAGLWVHGFADATGIVADWLEALLRAFGGTAIVDQPPDPFGSHESEAEFSAPLVARFAALGIREDEAALAPPRIELVRAPGAGAEMREVAQRVRALLDGAAEPESIAIVARDPAAYRPALAAQLARLAIPYSTHGLRAAPGARRARVAALLRLLDGAERAPIEAWLAASAQPADASQDLRVALHALGLGRVAELVALDLDAALGGESAFRLPVRHGASDDGDPAELRRRRPRQRRIARADLVAARERAAAIHARFATWPERAPFERHAAELAQLVEQDLGWSRGDALLAPLLGAFDALAAETPTAYEMSRDELAQIVRAEIEGAAAGRVGGAGGGVQVLSATAARGRCFDHVFVLGLNRDVFPRRPVLDPLLPDSLRAALVTVLPAIPIKARARAEERHLFAELLSSSEAVTLSWLFATDEGRECARSAFIERLRQVEPSLEDATVRLLEQEAESLRRAHEHLVRAALHGPRAALAKIRSAALREVRPPGAQDLDADVLAASQLAVLGELDPPYGRAPQLSPYGGRLGRALRAPESDALVYVTEIEGLARCAWRRVLERDLGLEPPPDALAALPSLSQQLVGTAVHEVLDHVVRDAGAAAGVPIAEAEAKGAVRVPWPDDSRLAEFVRDASERVARDEGIRSAPFVRALALATHAALEVAHETDFADLAGLSVVGAELEGEATLRDAEGRPRRIGFRADRVDADGERFVLTDYKTGSPLSDAKKPETRRSKLLAATAEGRSLQAAAYAAGSRARGEREVAGRLLYLRPEAEPSAREYRVDRQDSALLDAFEKTVRIVLAAADAGVYPPHLVAPGSDKAARHCAGCEVAAACSQGESGVRIRMRRWLEAAAADPAKLAPDERAAAALLALGREPETGGAQ